MMASPDSHWQKHKAGKRKRELCRMRASDEWGQFTRWGEKRENDGGYLARCSTSGLISLLGLGNHASTWWRKTRKWLHTKYKPTSWEKDAGAPAHASRGISMYHPSPRLGVRGLRNLCRASTVGCALNSEFLQLIRILIFLRVAKPYRELVR